MFASLPQAPPDAILGLSEAFKSDPHPEKINLTVGVFKDADGKTPILRCVKEAEKRLLVGEHDKAYLGIAGMADYTRHVQSLLFGDDHEILSSGRAATVQTPGGTGALRVAADFLHKFAAESKVWFSTPTWANHGNVLTAAQMETAAYPYLDADRTGMDFDAMLAGLRKIPPGDIVCLHACCHNPTGVDPSADQWRQIAETLAERELLPLIDFAYQGFAEGLKEDTAGLEQIAIACKEMLVCSSFSKNFGLYGERVGALTVVTDSADDAAAALSQVKSCVRANYSNPPKHGAAIVSTILVDEELRSAWREELAQMRERIRKMRKLFVATMREKAPQRDFSFVTRQRGMFSYSGLTPLQVDELRSKHSIYVVGDGRMNVAGMTSANMNRLCDCVAHVL